MSDLNSAAPSSVSDATQPSTTAPAADDGRTYITPAVYRDANGTVHLPTHIKGRPKPHHTQAAGEQSEATADTEHFREKPAEDATAIPPQ